MHATARWLQVHDPKSGGTSLSTILESLCGAKQVAGQHSPAWAANSSVADGREFIGTIRDPWRKYCSLYLHAINGPAHYRFLLKCYGRGSIAFRDVLFGLTHPWEVPVIPDHCPGVVWTPHDDTALDFESAGVGYATWAVLNVYGDNSPSVDGTTNLVKTLVATDRISEGAAELLGVGREDVAGIEPQNTRNVHRGWFKGKEKYRDWYDDEMIGWVAEADSLLIDRFGFEPFTASPQALYTFEE
jgi:hypothetical protein